MFAYEFFFLLLKILFIFLAPEYFRREITKSLCFSYAARTGCLPMSRRRNSYHATRFSNVATDLLGNEENLIAIICFTVFFSGNQHRPSFDLLGQRFCPSMPMKKSADDEESHVRTSSISSTIAPIIPSSSSIPPNQRLNVIHDSSANVKVQFFQENPLSNAF